MKEYLFLHYKLEKSLKALIGKDAKWVGNSSAEFVEIQSRKGLSFDGDGYVVLPEDLFNSIDNTTGFTFSSWVYTKEGNSVWERIFDFGSGEGLPSMFFTRNLRGTLSGFGDLIADGSKKYQENTWIHVAFVYHPTNKSKNSSAGIQVYVNGELIGDGVINQTTSGLFGQLKRWEEAIDDINYFRKNYLGHSQYKADPNFKGVLSDVMIFNKNLDSNDIIKIMADSLDDQEIIDIAIERDLDLGLHTITEDLVLPENLFGGMVDVEFESSNPNVLSHDGKVNQVLEPTSVQIKAKLRRNDVIHNEIFDFTVLPSDVPAYEIDITREKVTDVSDVLYGLFYEDINNAADGGIYAELVRNRSFEAFEFNDFMPNDNVCGCDQGRTHDPLQGWYGDLDKVEIQHSGGLNEFLKLDKGVNEHYIYIEDGTLINKGYNDSTHKTAMYLEEDGKYDLSFWVKGKANMNVYLADETGRKISNELNFNVDNDNWEKLTDVIQTHENCLGQLYLRVDGGVNVDVISLMPQKVWGNEEENISISSHNNYKSNPNYRLRPDLVKALWDLNPKFLRFPGGCISEGAFLWDNVFDWKQTIGSIEERKENYNLWGYSMTMGLGYFEYFQLAEDLNAYPLPVMACGVLCQARSDYAAPAGGSLRDYYIKNFTDLIDFAISTDFENNFWANKRKEMGHPEPFKLHYLGVGNENWGDEFFANFEIFKYEIEEYMKKHHPNHELHIISTVGAQADDEAFQEGWKFLHGDHYSVDKLQFTDGQNLFYEDVEWYKHASDYMDTIVDEHYYRSNDYLINNVDRYDFYKRVYDENGKLNEQKTSKVFVGEYASTDKNTLRGAISEAALMTGFENNSDVVRMASYAPLFNKVLFDSTYRWTPDLIWFDNEDVWFTPNYYNQKMFANNLGSRVLKTQAKGFYNGKKVTFEPEGGVMVTSTSSNILVESIKIVDNTDGKIIFENDFRKELSDKLGFISEENISHSEDGLLIKSDNAIPSGFYILEDWKDYRVDIKWQRISGINGLFVAVGLESITPKTCLEYVVDYQGHTTGLRVFKNGVEGYKMGDFSTSVVAGNMRRSLHHQLKNKVQIVTTISFDSENIEAYYNDGEGKKGFLTAKNRKYNNEIFHTVSEDDENLYIKIVNIHGIDKLIRFSLTSFSLNNVAKITTLGGKEDLLDIPNVNKKNHELVVPREEEIPLDGEELLVKIDKYSSNIIKIEKA